MSPAGIQINKNILKSVGPDEKYTQLTVWE